MKFYNYFYRFFAKFPENIRREKIYLNRGKQILVNCIPLNYKLKPALPNAASGQITEIYPAGNEFNFSSSEDQSNALIVNTTYNNQTSDNIVFSISYNENNLLGDLNFDGELNVLDIVLMVTVVLNNEYIEVADVNQDNMVNILDVVLMVNILVGGLPNN